MQSSRDDYGTQLYDEMRKIARRCMSRERPDHTLQPTALVHEAFIRLRRSSGIEFDDRTQFLALAATQMRRILVEHARAAGRKKRGARPVRVTLSDGLTATPEHPIDVLDVDDALQRLERKSPRQSRVIEMRLFSGMAVAEVAESLGVSERTVKEDWRVARAWLARELKIYEP